MINVYIYAWYQNLPVYGILETSGKEDEDHCLVSAGKFVLFNDAWSQKGHSALCRKDEDK